MRRGFLRRHKGAVLTATVAAMTACGIAYAAIPNQVNGEFYACYDNTRLQLQDSDANGQPAPCPTSMYMTHWAQRGPVGPTGPQGPRGNVGPTGPQGPPGRNDIHWVITRPGTYDNGVTSSDSGAAVYSWDAGAKFIWLPNVDVNRCAITVTAASPGSTTTDTGAYTTPIVTGFFRYYGYIVAYARKVVVVNGQATTQSINAELDVTAAC